jgi:hypothetical protein
MRRIGPSAPEPREDPWLLGSTIRLWKVPNEHGGEPKTTLLRNLNVAKLPCRLMSGAWRPEIMARSRYGFSGADRPADYTGLTLSATHGLRAPFDSK